MALQWPKPGPNLVGEYQVSGLPFATASLAGTSTPTSLQLPFVTRFVSVTNTGATTLAVGFTANGVKGGDRFTLPPSGSFHEQLRVKDLFFLGVGGSATFEVVAGLTMIERTMFPTLTGSAAAGVLAPYSNSDDYGYGPAGLG